jgi:hypothetical protein
MKPNIYPHQEQVDKILKANEKKTRYYVVELPCGHGSLEIKEPRDQIVICKKCGKNHFLIWSMTQPKWNINER